jgi:hypothetical protein
VHEKVPWLRPLWLAKLLLLCVFAEFSLQTLLQRPDYIAVIIISQERFFSVNSYLGLVMIEKFSEQGVQIVLGQLLFKVLQKIHEHKIHPTRFSSPFLFVVCLSRTVDDVPPFVLFDLSMFLSPQISL